MRLLKYFLNCILNPTETQTCSTLTSRFWRQEGRNILSAGRFYVDFITYISILGLAKLYQILYSSISYIEACCLASMSTKKTSHSLHTTQQRAILDLSSIFQLRRPPGVSTRTAIFDSALKPAPQDAYSPMVSLWPYRRTESQGLQEAQAQGKDLPGAGGVDGTPKGKTRTLPLRGAHAWQLDSKGPAEEVAEERRTG